MARRVNDYATSVVRLFPGYAESVIWFSSPVPYEETRLDPALIADLRAWDSSYYAGLGPDYSWRNHDDAARFRAAGARLARRLADQIGDDFQVEHERRVRAAGPARNPDAAAAFHQMADAAGTEQARLDEIVARARRNGHTLEWRADL